VVITSGFTRAQWLLLVAVSGSLLLDGVFLSALAPLLPQYIDEYGLSQAHVGLLVGSDAIGSVLAVPFAAWAVGRFGPRPTMLGGLVSVSVGALVFGLAQSAWLLDVSRGAVGGMCSFSWAAGFTWLARGIDPQLRARSIGLVMGAGGAGSLLGPALGTVGVYAGTLAVFGAVGAMYLALAAMALRVPAPPHRPATSAAVLRERARRQSGVVWGGLAWIVILPALISAVLLVQIPVRLDGLGFTAAAIGLVFSAAAVLDVVVSPLIGWWADHKGRSVPLRTGTLVIALATLLLPIVGRSLLVVALTVATSVGMMMLAGPTLAMLADRFEVLELPYEIAFSGQTMGWAVGSIAGALGAGVIADAMTPWAPFAFVAVLALVTWAGLTHAARAVDGLTAAEHGEAGPG
jgi:MFS transporter, DHA1 family, multidrug resistance protein